MSILVPHTPFPATEVRRFEGLGQVALSEGPDGRGLHEQFKKVMRQWTNRQTRFSTETNAPLTGSVFQTVHRIRVRFLPSKPMPIRERLFEDDLDG